MVIKAKLGRFECKGDFLMMNERPHDMKETFALIIAAGENVSRYMVWIISKRFREEVVDS